MKMENKQENFVINGGVKMPIGYRFHPTDEEVVIHYLKRKVEGIPLPAAIIPDFDVFQTHPCDLPGDVREKRYFFYNDQMNGNINVNGNCGRKRVAHAAASGYWKPINGKDKQILASESNEAVGLRKTLVFCQRNRYHGTKTRWLMHEFRLILSSQESQSMKMGNWVVYRVFQKRRKPAKKASNTKTSRTVEVFESPSNSSCLSQITELDDQEENTSAPDHFHTY